MQAKPRLSLATFLTAVLPTLLSSHGTDLSAQTATPHTPDHPSLKDTQYRKGPTLRNKHWRNLFYGYDTLNYRLISDQGQYRLVVSADYGDRDRRYFSARLPDDSDRELNDYRHQKQRCQFFNTMVYACLIRDEFTIPIHASEVLAGQQTGLQFTLRSKTASYEILKVPSDYLRKFLQTSPSKQAHSETP